MPAKQPEPEEGQLLEPHVIEEYLSDCRENVRRAYEDVRSLRAEGARGQSAKRLKKFGHQLVGSGGTYGYERVSREGGKLASLMEAVITGARPLDDGALAEISASLDGIKASFKLTVKRST